MFSNCERGARKCRRNKPQRRKSSCQNRYSRQRVAGWAAVAPQGQPTPADHQDGGKLFYLPTSGRPHQLCAISRSEPTGPNLAIQKTNSKGASSWPTMGTKDTPFPFIPNQIFPFLCFTSRGKMAEDKPHLCIEMSESSANGIPSRMQSSPDLAGRAGSVLTFHNICYRVKTRTGFLCFKKTTEKEVLRDVKYVCKHLFRVRISFISVPRVDFTCVTEPFSTTCRSRFRKIILVALCLLPSVPGLSLYIRELPPLIPGGAAPLAAISTGHSCQLCSPYAPWQSSHWAGVFGWDTNSLSSLVVSFPQAALGKVSFLGGLTWKSNISEG